MHFLFEKHELDEGRRELWRSGELIAVEPQVFDLIAYLIRNRERVVSKDDLIAGVWDGRIVSDSTLTSRINAARKALGDNGEQQRLIRTIARKGIRFVGEVDEIANGVPAAGDAAPTGEPPAPEALRQDIRFCMSSDGLRIAYASVGSGPPLVKAANWLTHLEHDWQGPVWRPLMQALTERYRLIRYDARGNGLSDWEVDTLSFDSFVSDLESVVEATKLERFALLGLSQGAAVSVAYAARHPERVSHLVLYGGLVQGRRKRSSPAQLAQSEAMLTLMRQGWGQDNPAFRQMFTSLFIPGATAEQMQWLNDMQRLTTSPDNAVRLRQTIDEIDITDLLPLVKAPTLVLHCRDDAVQPLDQGRRLAAGIKDARFVALEGRNHIILKGDPGWERFHDEIKAFLGQ